MCCGRTRHLCRVFCRLSCCHVSRAPFPVSRVPCLRVSPRLQEEEIFHMDHYLGKMMVNAITEWRSKNPQVLRSLYYYISLSIYIYCY